ncbi:MAG: hypothetical protein U5K76_12400 [Woeseiaceae bacterium]|nr:hypothetical protein [Woeseiaceae bacterium]
MSFIDPTEFTEEGVVEEVVGYGRCSTVARRHPGMFSLYVGGDLQPTGIDLSYGPGGRLYRGIGESTESGSGIQAFPFDEGVEILVDSIELEEVGTFEFSHNAPVKLSFRLVDIVGFNP